MMSFRSIARVLPRSARCFTTPVVRRSLTIATQASLRQPWTPALQTTARFSTTPARREAGGSVNQELAVALASELQIESETTDSDAVPLTVKEYLENTEFEIEDTPGQDEVILTRKFGDETIRVSFTIEDLNQMDTDAEADESLMDEIEDPADVPSNMEGSGGRSKNINQGSGGNFSQAPEDSIAAADAEGEELQDDMAVSFPANVAIKIERAGKGALQIDAVAQDGLFVIDNVSYFKDSNLAMASTSENEFKTRDMYTGPPFGNLDEELQLLFERYIDERGINVAMAAFIPEYIDYKEQREYTEWLRNVKEFVE